MGIIPGVLCPLNKKWLKFKCNTVETSAWSMGVNVPQYWMCMHEAHQNLKTCFSQRHRARFVNNTSKSCIASYRRSPRKQSKTNSSTHRSCCAQWKMIHLLRQGAHHICWLHWHRMVHCRRNHSTLQAHTMSIWKQVPQGRKLLKTINTVNYLNVKCVYFLMKRISSTMYDFLHPPMPFCCYLNR